MARGLDAARVGVWRERFLRFDGGTVKVEDFCLAEGVSKSSFYHWRRKLELPRRPSSPTRQGRKTQQTNGRGAFEPVTIAATAMVVIRLPDGTLIEVPTGSEQALRVIVGQLVPANIEAARC
jgi:hypothetical protein